MTAALSNFTFILWWAGNFM